MAKWRVFAKELAGETVIEADKVDWGGTMVSFTRGSGTAMEVVCIVPTTELVLAEKVQQT